MSRLAVGLALVVAILVAAPTAPAQEPKKQLKPEERTAYHGLRGLLNEMGVKPVADFDAAAKDAGQTILVMLGDPSWLRDQPRGYLRDFVKAGGAVLIATDHDLLNDTAWNGELRGLTGVSVAGDPVVCAEAANRYDDLPELPLLELAELHPNDPAPLTAFQGLAGSPRIAASLPGRLAVLPALFERAQVVRTMRLVAFLPEGAALQRDYRLRGDRAPRLEEEQHWFGLAGQPPGHAGKVVLLADHHVFMNDLVFREDLGNFDFAATTLRYLAEGPGPDQTRTKCLLLDNGRVETDFNVVLDGLLEFDFETLRREARKLEIGLSVLARQGKFDAAAWRWLENNNFSPAKFWMLAGLALTGLAALYVVYRLLASRAPVEVGLPRLGRSLEKQVPTARLAAQRLEEQLDHGRLYEPARHLARSMFLGAGLAAGPKPPPVRISGGWWARWRGAARFRRLWRLAFADRPVPVTARQWPGLVRDVADVRQGLLDGTIQPEAATAA